MEQDTIFNYIVSQEAAYAQPVDVNDSWQWSMKDHIITSKLYKHSQLKTGKGDDKPVKNITRPILNLQYRAEGFDVKDIELFVNDKQFFYKSFVIRKYYHKYARLNNIDTFIDDLVESYIDYGGALVKKTKSKCPEVVPLESIVFCDQYNLLAGPIGIKHSYSAAELKDAEKDMGWGNQEYGATGSIDELLTLASAQPSTDSKKKNASTIDVYEVHGRLPKRYLDPEASAFEYEDQIQIVAFYHDSKGDKKFFTLFAMKEKKSPFKLLIRDKIFNRALGFGGAEELFDAQVWSTYGMIRMKEMLDAAAKTLFQTTDPGFTNRNRIDEADNNEVMVLEDGKTISQIDTYPRNMVLFEKWNEGLAQDAQRMGSANDAAMGVSPSSGTPFKLQELVTENNNSLHEYRKGKIATFVDEVHRDWIIPDVVLEMNNGQEFLSELSLKELQEIADALVLCEAEKLKRDNVLKFKNGLPGTEDEIESFKQKVRSEFMRGGKKRFMKIFENETKNLAVDVYTNIAGKQSYTVEKVQKLTNVFRQILANPAILQNKAMADLFNQILEFSGLSPLDFDMSGYSQPNQQQVQAGGQESPLSTPAAPATAVV